MFGLFKKKGGEAPEERERPQKAADQEIRAGIHASWPSPAPTPSGAAPGRTGCG